MVGLNDPSDHRSIDGTDAAVDLLHLGSIGVDEWTDVRYVHASAFRVLVGPHVGHQHIEAFNRRVEQPEYAYELSCMNLTGAWLAGELAGTAGWRPAASDGRIAEIVALFVRPIFTTMGIGSRLLEHVESEARAAGFTSFVVRANEGSVPFFDVCGYDIASYGSEAVAEGPPMSIIRMRKLVTDTRFEEAAEDSHRRQREPSEDALVDQPMQPTQARAMTGAADTGLLFGAIPERE